MFSPVNEIIMDDDNITVVTAEHGHNSVVINWLLSYDVKVINK